MIMNKSSVGFQVENVLTILILLGFLSFAHAQENDILPEGLHTAPVSILTPPNQSLHGTGIYLFESNKLFLVTAAHCLFNTESTNFNELSFPTVITTSFTIRKNPGDNSKYVLVLDLQKLMSNGKIKRHPTHDVAVVELADLRPSTNDSTTTLWLEGVGQPHFEHSLMLAMWDATHCATFTNVLDGAPSLILGYPAELLNGEMASEVDFDYPLIRRGVISQKNYKRTKLIIDSGVFGGNSGGPVVIVDHSNPAVTSYNVAGLVTEFVASKTRAFPKAGFPDSVLLYSGYSVAEPIDFALELMRQF